VADKVLALTALQPVIEVGNPLGDYPDRSWERVYHDQYRYDSSFTWVCSPNDTHACRVRAFVRNGVVMRVEQNYDHQTYEDLYGNRGTFAHNPRMCLKGFTFHRRVYGPYRLKGPLMRKGWKQWMDDGSPELTPETKRKYKFDSRFLDDMLRVSWDTAFTYAAKAMIIIATRYSGEAGARRLRAQGYAPEMIEMMKGAGVRCFKHRAGMPILGLIGKHGIPVLTTACCRYWTVGSARSIPIRRRGAASRAIPTISGAPDDSCEVQPGLSLPRDDGQTCAVRGDGQVGQGA
jgi:nitrate reductase alpha subunit